MSKGGHGGESNPLRGCAADTILLPVKVCRTSLAFLHCSKICFEQKAEWRFIKLFFIQSQLVLWWNLSLNNIILECCKILSFATLLFLFRQHAFHGGTTLLGHGICFESSVNGAEKQYDLGKTINIGDFSRGMNNVFYMCLSVIFFCILHHINGYGGWIVIKEKNGKKAKRVCIFEFGRL